MKPKRLLCAARAPHRRKPKHNRKTTRSQPEPPPRPASPSPLRFLLATLARIERKVDDSHAALSAKLDSLLAAKAQQASPPPPPEPQPRKLFPVSASCVQEPFEEIEEPKTPLEPTPVKRGAQKRLRWADNTPPRRTHTFYEPPAVEASTDCILKLLRQESAPVKNLLNEEEQEERGSGGGLLPTADSGASPVDPADILLQPRGETTTAPPSEDDEIFKLLNKSAVDSSSQSFELQINIATSEDETPHDEVLDLLTSESPPRAPFTERNNTQNNDIFAMLNDVEPPALSDRALRYLDDDE